MRLAERERGVAPLARRMKPLSPSVVCIVMKAIVPTVNQAVANAQLDVEHEELPFPARQRPQYVTQLAALVKQWKRRGVLHAVDGSR